MEDAPGAKINNEDKIIFFFFGLWFMDLGMEEAGFDIARFQKNTNRF